MRVIMTNAAQFVCIPPSMQLQPCSRASKTGLNYPPSSKSIPLTNALRFSRRFAASSSASTAAHQSKLFKRMRCRPPLSLWTSRSRCILDCLQQLHAATTALLCMRLAIVPL